MIVKAFEIRDKGTFIPALGILMEPGHGAEKEVERWLLRRAGFSCEQKPGWPCDVVLCRMEAKGIDRNATYDPYSWGDRTFHVAHTFISAHWNDLQSGAVICVEHILGERDTPKESERIT